MKLLKEKFAVAVKDGRFFALDESFSCTSPYWVDHPSKAHRIKADPAKPLERPTYYFEGSSRMEHWLAGSRMVWVEVETEADLGLMGPSEPPPPKIEKRTGDPFQDAMIASILASNPFIELMNDIKKDIKAQL